jgi:hypothetical protein
MVKPTPDARVGSPDGHPLLDAPAEKDGDCVPDESRRFDELVSQRLSVVSLATRKRTG